MNKPGKLGQGLDALLGTTATKGFPTAADNIRMIGIEQLYSGSYQPRMDMDEDALQQLADSIKSHGIIQPIIARETDHGERFEIIAGERRWRAAQLAALHEVPVIVRTLTDQSAMAMALIENIQREDLNPVEEAKLMKRLADEFSLSHAEIGESVGKSRATITNMLRLLTLTPPVLDLLQNLQIETGHAKVLLALDGADQIEAAKAVVKNSLNVRRTEALVKGWNNRKSQAGTIEADTSDPDIARLEMALSERVEAKVAIHDRNGKGFIKINYKNLDELDGILERIHVTVN